MTAVGVNGLVNYIRANELLDSLSNLTYISMSDKLQGYAYIAYPLFFGLSTMFMGISIAINNKKNQVTGFATLPIVSSLLAYIPSTIFIIIGINKIMNFSKGYEYDGIGKIIALYVILIFAGFFLMLSIITGSLTYVFKGTRRNNYTPLNELNLSSPYAPVNNAPKQPFSATTLSADTFSNSIPEKTQFYQPYKDEDNSSDSGFYEPFSNETAAESLSHVQSSNVVNSYENEVHFTATSDNYVEHQFNTPDDAEAVVIEHMEAPSGNAVNESAATSYEENATMDYKTPVNTTYEAPLTNAYGEPIEIAKEEPSPSSYIPTPIFTSEEANIVAPVPKAPAPKADAPKSNIIIEDGNTLAEKNVSNHFSVADEINKFKQLADTGVISQAEFEIKKQQLLKL